MSIEPVVKGWCPGAYRPMMAADGLVVRVRPRLARLSISQAAGLCDVALRYGSGFVDLTNRANLQVRGVSQDDHGAVLDALGALALLDSDPSLESRRNVLVSPFWAEGDLVSGLTSDLLDRLSELPELPAKVGFAVDCAEAPLLSRDPADIRVERGQDGLIVRADGAALGRVVSTDHAIDALVEMAQWLAAHITPDARRMAAVVARNVLPAEWEQSAPLPRAQRPVIGSLPQGALIGVPFGQIDARALLAHLPGATALRVTPWRCFLLEGAPLPGDAAFISVAGDPLERVDACPGAPLCAHSSVETRALARRVAPLMQGTLHVSGCSKGCAQAQATDLTLVGRDGRFDLIRNGRANDIPDETGLLPEILLSGAI